MMFRNPFLKDRSGATVVEFALLAPVIMVLIIGLFELTVFVYQWNNHHRATRAAVRLASFSAPVADQLNIIAASGLPGSEIPNYSITCDGSSKTCTEGTYNSTAMNRILNGGDGKCEQQTQTHLRGLCDMITDLTEANIVIEYNASMKEVSSAPGGLQPVVTLRVKNSAMKYTLLSAFGGVLNKVPDTSATLLGQDLSDGGFQ